MKCAIFPLPIFLLPQGYTRLRIFEERYLRMVKESLKSETGFVLCNTDNTANKGAIFEGVYVEIVDFSQDESGYLLVDVYALSNVNITNVVEDSTQLCYGDMIFEKRSLWRSNLDSKRCHHIELATMLEETFKNHPHINSLYKEQAFDTPVWVASRWLELLPLENGQKEKIKTVTDFEQVVDFLHTVLIESK
ncbi:LON peptidase substrate-binding domain-containing protein [Pseudoalteromonas aurantia]